MIVLPPAIAARIEQCVQGREGPNTAIDQEARTHGTVALMTSVGMNWGLRPDGTFWMFDADFEVPLEPLPADCEMQALVWGACRFPWLSDLVPVRPAGVPDCTSCAGTGFRSATWMCPRCEGLGWSRESRGPA